MRSVTRALVLAAMAPALLGAGGASRAQSLWSPGSTSLFTDVKARKVGDLVTVIVSESATSEQSASTDLAKKSKAEVSRGIGIGLALIPRLGLEGGDSSSASGTTTRSSTLVARMTVRVREVLPNGNLVLEGGRTVTTNKEKQEMVFRGVVRPTDIQPDNTVLSSLVADAEITLNGKGPIAARQKPGLFSRLLHVLF